MTNKQLPYIITSIILVLLVGAAIFFIHMPLAEKMSKAKQELQQKKSQFLIVQKKVRELDKLRKNLGQLEKETLRLQNQIPNRPDVPSVVDYLEKYAEASGVIVTSVKFNATQPTTGPAPTQPGQPTSGQSGTTTQPAAAGQTTPTPQATNINVNICSLSLQGQYTSIIRFFEQIKSSPRLFSIKDIKFSPQGDDGKEIKVDLDLAYFNYLGAPSVVKSTENKG
jgi:Tfp pilus assembly protein PilO